MRRLSLVLPFLLLTASLVADEHRILDAQHVLSDDEKAAFAARGCEVQRALANGRYLVRLTSGSDVTVRDPRVRSLEPISAEKKIQPSAYRVAASAKTYARVRVLFHDDVTFDAARDTIARAGGTVDNFLNTAFEGDPRSIVARIPSMGLTELASDENVLVVTGPPLRAKSHNATAAAISNVTAVQAAPYNLTGAGVVLGIFEVDEGRVDEGHGEFGGRVTQHASTTIPAGQHATHVAGTMIAEGINPRAKGMAPKATLHSFVGGDVDDHWFIDRRNLPNFGIAAENNSWGYILGWCEPPDCGSSWVWLGFDELIGGYDGFYSASIDKTARTDGSLSVWSAGNEADLFGPTSPPFAHKHVDDDSNVIAGETFCYSANGSGNDCPAQCTATPGHCETTRHPVHTPFGSISLTSSAKNVLAVGSVNDNRTITDYSSRGPARDGRVKPDLVANGASVLSTWPANAYGTMDGTSMASPVVTGTSALMIEQWKKS
ncbi:MAG: S8 family serine peptidase, partial [Acidobacteria bacterium]|nr:S8 family serine peptidase [Acidobacteriota bacterium]